MRKQPFRKESGFVLVMSVKSDQAFGASLRLQRAVSTGQTRAMALGSQRRIPETNSIGFKFLYVI